MSDIFISYNRQDQLVAARFARAFESAGFSVWWDVTLRAGEAYDEVTEAALRGAKAVVVLWSTRSVTSRWVRAEATLAERAGTLVPVMIEPCERPIMFELIQTAELSNWTGSLSSKAWTEFIDHVARLVGRESAPAQPPLAEREPVLAVLAFENRSADENLSYFSDGVSEEILYSVTRAKDLRVIGRASSFQFRGSAKSPQRVAEELGATHMLDGSVRRAGDTIRIHVELVDTLTRETLWSERYERALTDVFVLQDEIAAAVATALRRHFSRGTTTEHVDPAAYDLYLRARAILTEDSSWEDRERCAALLEGAVALDPQFAHAWGPLAAMRTGKAAVHAAMQGLALNPDCASSLIGLTFTKRGADQHTERLRLIERAYDLAPDDSFVSSAYISVLLSLGLLSRAITVADAKFERDPLSPIAAGLRSFAYCYAGRTEEAIRFADAFLVRQPNSEYAKFSRGALAIYSGDLDGADAIADTMSSKNRVMALRPPAAFIRAMLAMAPDERAGAVDKLLHRNAPISYLLDIGLASVVGEVDAAIEHLLGAIAAGRRVEFTADNDGRDPTGSLVSIGLFVPAFRPMRFDPRFAEICVKMGLYTCWMETGQWPDCIAEVAPIYDLKSELARAAAGIRPPANNVVQSGD